MDIEEVLCKFITIVSGKELMGISLAEPDAHLLPLVMLIDPDYMKNCLNQTVKSGFEKIIHMVESFLGHNAIDEKFDNDITALENRERSQILALVMQILAIYSVFEQDSFVKHISELEEEEYTVLLENVRQMAEPLKDEIAKLYTRVSTDDKVYLNSLMKKVKENEKIMDQMDAYIHKLEQEQVKLQNQLRDTNGIVKEKESEIDTLKLIKNDIESKHELANLQKKNLDEQMFKIFDSQ